MDISISQSSLEEQPKDKNEEQPRFEKLEKKKGKRQKMDDVNELTEYEKLIQKNKNEKHAFLDSLKINEVKESLSEAVRDYKKVGRKKWTKIPPPAPRLKIARSSKVDIDLSEGAIADRTVFKAMETSEAPQQKEIVEELPTLLSLENVLDSGQSYESFLDDLKDLDQGNTEPIDDYESRFQDMELLESHIARFNNTRLTAMDIHPMRENTIIAAGGYNGNFYLWNINSDSIPYAFQVHSKRISQLKFNPENPHLIMSASNDGTLREGDLVANVYKMLTKDTDCNYFDFLSPDTCLVSHNDGYVSVVDMRDVRAMNRKRQMAHKCHNLGIKSVSVHPVNKNEFITPSSKGIFDTSLWNITSSCKFSEERPPYSQATWQPRTDHKFAVESLNLPREIEIWNYNQKIYSASHELLQGLIYFCTFHPSLPIIAAVQNSKIYVFANKNH